MTLLEDLSQKETFSLATVRGKIKNGIEVLGIWRLLLFGIIAQHGDLHSEYISWSW